MLALRYMEEYGTVTKLSLKCDKILSLVVHTIILTFITIREKKVLYIYKNSALGTEKWCLFDQKITILVLLRYKNYLVLVPQRYQYSAFFAKKGTVFQNGSLNVLF